MFRKLAAMCTVLLVFALLASCGAPSTSTTTSPSSSSSSVSPSPTPSSTTPPVKEKIVRFAQQWPCKIDPAVGLDNVASLVQNNLYETLLEIAADGSLKPEIAKSWDLDEATNTYTFHLNTDIKFHNGDTVTASDIVFSLNRLLKVGEGWGYLFMGRVDTWTAKDPQTVSFTLKRPYAIFPYMLAYLFILNEKQVMANKKDGNYGDFGDYGRDWLTTHDAGSGPFTVTEWKPEQYLLAERFKDYRGTWDINAPDGFQILFTTEPVTVRTLMAQKQLEVTDSGEPLENLKSMDAMPGINIANLRAGGMMYLFFNTSKPPLDDIHVRRALQYCFDYATCKEQIYPNGIVTNGPVAGALKGFVASLPVFKQDLEKAKAEIALSNYADQLSAYPMDFVWVDAAPDEEKVALLLQSQAQELGFKINILKTPWLSVVDQVASAETSAHLTTIIFSSISVPYPEAGAMIETAYYSAGRGTVNNIHWFDAQTQADLDKMIEDMMSTSNEQDRLAKYATVTQKIVDLAPDIWPIEMPQTYAYQDYLLWPEAQGSEWGKSVSMAPGHCLMNFKDVRFIPEKMP